MVSLKPVQRMMGIPSLKKTEIVLKVVREMPIRVLYEYGKTKSLIFS